MGARQRRTLAIPAPSPTRPTSLEPTDRQRLSRRRRRAARWAGCVLAALLVASWWLLRADAHSLPELLPASARAWLAAVSAAPQALQARLGGSRPPSSASEIAPRRAGSHLEQAPTAPPVAALPPEAVAAALTVTLEGPAPAPPAGGGPASAPAPTSERDDAPVAPATPPAEQAAAPPMEVDAEPDAEPDPGTDVLVDLDPSDFDGSLGVDLGGGRLDVGADVGGDDVLAVDSSARVDAGAEGVDLGADLGAGPASTSVQVAVEPDRLAASADLAIDPVGAALDLGAGSGRADAQVQLDAAGIPADVAVAAGSGGLELDVSTGGLVPGALGEVEVDTERLELPLDLPLDVRLH